MANGTVYGRRYSINN